MPTLAAALLALAAPFAADAADAPPAVAPPPAPAAHDPINPAVGHDDEDEGDTDVEVIRHGQREGGGGFGWRVGATVAIGLEDRLDGALVSHRDDGNVIDAYGALRIAELGRPPTRIVPGGLRERSLTLVGGTDRISDRPGRALFDLAAAERGWRGEMPVYTIAAHGGWSDRRSGLIGGEAIVGLLHVGVDRDDSGHWYRVGFKYVSAPRPFTAELSVDRVISFQLDDRFYGTETRFAGTVPLTDNLAASLGVAYMHGARDARGRLDHTWEGGVSLTWRLGSDL